jgi:hypothetical protein
VALEVVGGFETFEIWMCLAVVRLRELYVLVQLLQLQNNLASVEVGYSKSPSACCCYCKGKDVPYLPYRLGCF